ncbi:BQ2448_30 [Microbotryum intermedium]|uniref:BQ2448_30 protein n=1 Tax=Microbotryum intermedium TaxID=269621 RepID=A0A238FLY5_9BASI|nr:BQ2448_30 [Microbotryum intermedium]
MTKRRVVPVETSKRYQPHWSNTQTPPRPPGLTATKSYSAAVGATPPAKAATVIATGPPAVAAPRSHPLMHDIANRVIVKTPPGSTPEQEADLRELVARGLTVGKTLCKVNDLFHIAQKSVIQCTLVGFFSDPEGVRLFDEKIKEFGTVLMRRTQYVGKTKHISGVYDFVLALKDPNRIPLRITGGMRHCSVFCRSGAHVRKECTVAPPCKICTKTSHATQHCPGRHGSSPQAASTSTCLASSRRRRHRRRIQHRFRDRRLRPQNQKKSKREYSGSPSLIFQSNDASPMPISRTFTFTPQAAPQLAPIQGNSFPG